MTILLLKQTKYNLIYFRWGLEVRFVPYTVSVREVLPMQMAQTANTSTDWEFSRHKIQKNQNSDF